MVLLSSPTSHCTSAANNLVQGSHRFLNFLFKHTKFKVPLGRHLELSEQKRNASTNQRCPHFKHYWAVNAARTRTILMQLQKHSGRCEKLEIMFVIY